MTYRFEFPDHEELEVFTGHYNGRKLKGETSWSAFRTKAVGAHNFEFWEHEGEAFDYPSKTFADVVYEESKYMNDSFRIEYYMNQDSHYPYYVFEVVPLGDNEWCWEIEGTRRQGKPLELWKVLRRVFETSVGD